jgi:hypothetical protein
MKLKFGFLHNHDKTRNDLVDYFKEKFTIERAILSKKIEVPNSFIINNLFTISKHEFPILYSDLENKFIKTKAKGKDIFYIDNSIYYKEEVTNLILDDTITLKDIAEFCDIYKYTFLAFMDEINISVNLEQRHP